MLPHLKQYSDKEKEAARIAFDEGARQRAEAIKNQKRLTEKEILKLFKKNKS